MDIDQQAVEVTRLSLLLKMLEGETSQSLSSTGLMDRILPDLDQTIRCGNALVGPDIIDENWWKRPAAERERIRPFDWHTAFPKVFGRGGFDCVVGNPPYVRQEMLGELKAYLSTHYAVAHGSADLYCYFIEGGLALLRPEGYYGVIVADKWLRAAYGAPLRAWLRERKIERITEFGDLPVFAGATTYPLILLLRNASSTPAFPVVRVRSLDATLTEQMEALGQTVAVEMLRPDGWNLADEKSARLLERLRAEGIPLREYVEDKIYRGVLTGLNEAFVLDRATRDRLIEQDPRSAEIIKPFLLGRDIKRYAAPVAERWLIFARRGIDIQEYPAVLAYLTQFREQLEPKPKNWKAGEWLGRKPGNYQWYELQDAVDYYPVFEGIKIIYPNICKRPEFTLDMNGIYTNQKCFIIGTRNDALMGVLNSRLSLWWFGQVLPKLRGGFFEPSYVFLKEFPIPAALSELTVQIEQLERLVKRQLDLHRRRADQEYQSERGSIEGAIAATDRAIDELVYGLYGLSQEEIAVVEGRA